VSFPRPREKIYREKKREQGQERRHREREEKREGD
jgi:hypothetical protein